jgi:hypothetical protein
MFFGLPDPDPDPLVTGTDPDPESRSFPGSFFFSHKFVERTEIVLAK